jgi:adenylyl-sulfate kinase
MAARCIWLTGLSGAGKSSVAQLLAKALAADGLPCCVLDGDALRSGLNSDLGFSPSDREQSVRRTAHVARLMVDAGVTAVVALISPYRADRAAARALFAPGEFVEVFVDTPLAVCEQRDPKGLYAKARAANH